MQVFFVISGFAIASSLRGADITQRFVWRFIVRRQVRLDPPYWATLLLASANRYVPWLDPIREKSLRPPIGQIVSHVFYLQNVLGEGDIVVVFWTLCIEVQFYLVFILLRGLEERLRRAKDPRSSERALLLVFAPPALGSLAYLLVDSSKSAWLIPYWHMFALGRLRATSGALPRGLRCAGDRGGPAKNTRSSL